MKSKIAVLIPCYNESKTIAKVVKDYKEALPEADRAEMCCLRWEISINMPTC